MKKSLLPRLLALTVLGVTVPALLSGQTVRTRDASGREITRRCQPAMSRKELPPMDAVIDSATAVQQLAGFSPGDAARWLLSLSFAKHGTTPTVRWLEPETGPDTVRRILSGAARLREGGEAWAVRLRVEPGSSGAIALEPALYCPPQPSVSVHDDPVMHSVEIGPGDRLPTSGRRIQMVAEDLVLETGALADIRMVRGSGIRELDDSFIRYLHRIPFLPALLEGVPVAARFRTDGSSRPL